MLHAAAMLIGLSVLWALVAQRVSSPQDWAIAAAVSLACVVVALRFGGASSAFARAPRLWMLSAARTGAVARGALATLRASASADVTMKPALVRVRSRAVRAAERASFANMISATPGMAVVETDSDGLLVHVLDEDAIDAADLGRLEGRVVSDGGR
ncbi:MAG: Na+/H+ antiporter subunit E [Hyphomonadaceae bacterium]|nr:Na+/H+ antiporter subunit E [Hyphomonadaceae bacterium]